MSIMFIGIGLVEALPIIGVVIAFMTLFNKKISWRSHLDLRRSFYLMASGD